jgi:hypothetical protein
MLKDQVVRSIVMSQFETLRSDIENADPEHGVLPIVRLTELFTFKVKPKKLEFLRGKKRYLRIQRERSLKLKKQKESE